MVLEDPSTIPYLQASNEDADSALGDIESPLSSDDGSVISEAEKYTEESNRTYHANWTRGHYLLPNDEKEQKRLEIQHQLLIATDGLHKAPIPHGLQRVLDVGTGTGQWANIFADTYPSATVTAADISPNVMPTETHPNCNFLVDDAEDDIGLGHHGFEYIHVRLLHGLRHPCDFINRSFDALVPGGYIEITLKTWSAIVVDGALKLGIDLTIVDKFPAMLKAGGFEDSEESTCIWSIKTRIQQQDYWLETLEAFAWRTFREMDWREEEIPYLLAKARAEICRNEVRASMSIRIVWTKRP